VLWRNSIVFKFVDEGWVREDTSKARNYYDETEVVPGHSLAESGVDLIGKHTHDWGGDSVCNLAGEQAKTGQMR
jgi:hypothetical protein